jgi:hypothetical protein
MASVTSALKKLNGEGPKTVAKHDGPSYVPEGCEGLGPSQKPDIHQANGAGDSLLQGKPPPGNAAKGKRGRDVATGDTTEPERVDAPDSNVEQCMWTAEMLEQAVWSMCTLPSTETETYSGKAHKRAKK